MENLSKCNAQVWNINRRFRSLIYELKMKQSTKPYGMEIQLLMNAQAKANKQTKERKEMKTLATEEGELNTPTRNRNKQAVVAFFEKKMK